MINEVEKFGISFRMSKDVVSKLDELCSIYNMSRRQVIETLIVGEYDKYQGNPKVKEIAEQVKILSDKIKEFASSGK